MTGRVRAAVMIVRMLALPLSFLLLGLGSWASCWVTDAGR